MKRFLLMLFLFVSLGVVAQTDTFKVKDDSFHKIDGCITIPPRYDDNNVVMAVVKIIPENINEQERVKLYFEGNLATFIEVEQKIGETWVYLTAEAATFLRIKHPDFGVTEFWFPMDLKPKQCYEMVLQYVPMNAGKDEPEKPQNNFLTINVEQQDAAIFIDDAYIGNGSVDKPLLIGKEHTYRIECDLYHTKTGKVMITEGEPIEINVNLSPAHGFINVNTTPEEGAIVYIDGKKVGTTPYASDKLASGNYKVKVLKTMFNPVEQTVTVTDGNITQATLKMDANFVTLTINVDSDPDADIYVDDEFKGKGSWKGRLSEGSHFVEARKNGHKTSTKNINLVLGNDETITIEKPEPVNGYLELSSKPSKADIYIDGKYIGQTPRVISDILVGQHELKLQKQGYASLTKNIDIKEGVTLSLSESLQTADAATTTGSDEPSYDKPSAKKTDAAKGNKEKTNVNFMTLNAAYSIAPQMSFGLTFGQVNKIGWFVNAMTNFNFRFKALDNSNFGKYEENSVVTLTGNDSRARLSVTAGLVCELSESVYAKVGAGYGMRVRCLEDTNGNWYQIAENTYKGLDLSAGLMYETKGYSISADVVTTNFKYIEVKLGFGINWN